MRVITYKICSVLFVLALVLLMGGGLWAQEKADVSDPVVPFSMDRDLRDLPLAAAWKPGDAVREVPQMDESDGISGARGGTVSDGTEGVQQGAPEFLMPSPMRNFEGISFTGVRPPDTQGDVGPNHYIQVVNMKYAVYNKSGTLLAGPSNINTLWAGAGGRCESDNDGDPIVLYDHLADRWMISQFVVFSHQCIAVSKGSDPITSGWWLYEFATGVTNDYPKLAVWPDGYYMGTNRGYPSSGGDAWVFDRTRMLSGLSATSQRFQTAPAPSIFVLPSELDGATPPPAGAPNTFAMMVDGAEWGGNDRIRLFDFHVDWANPSNSTFTELPSLNTTAFDRQLCGVYDLMGVCIPQKDTTRLLESLTAWLMWRLQYRNFGTHQTLVVNHTVDLDGSDHAGIRWYELRKTTGNWFINQEGTYGPDSSHRWMGSLAMDGEGNMALGFSVSSDTMFPAIKYVGRTIYDPLNQMPQGESEIMAGLGSQSASYRWGDYSSMNVDPSDDCTFWYTTEYIDTGGNWRTRIASFKYPTCGVSWNVCIKDAAYPTEYRLNIEDAGMLLRGAAYYPSPGFPAPLTGIFDPASNTATFSVDYKDESGLRFYRLNVGTLTGETWGIQDSDAGFYDGPRPATIEGCLSSAAVVSKGEKSGASK